MNLRFMKIKIPAFLFLVLLFFLFKPRNNFPQDKYDFDFNSNWKWEDLFEKAVLINPALIKSVEYLKNKASNEDARIIFKLLAQLDSLNDIKKLSVISEKVKHDYNNEFDSALIKLDSLYIVEDFGGMVSAAMALTEIRTSFNNNLFIFNNRNYLYQPGKEFKKNFAMTFDYSFSDKILNYYNSYPDTFSGILETAPYKFIRSELDKDSLIYCLSESAKPELLLSIYKWVNPGSFGNFGGVSIYKDNLDSVINILKRNETNIKSDVLSHVSGYLPDSIYFDVNVIVLLGKKRPGFSSGKNNIELNLEYFGDDYNYITRYIKYQTFKIAYKEIRIPIDKFIVKNNDKNLIELLSNILENGTSNYISPIGTETRPWYLLEKDFKLFNTAFKNYYKKNNKKKLDSLINLGYSGDAPFYTMATQMAYIIETTLGRNALVESIRLGPIAFFSKYIEAYKEFPDRIRKVFTFSSKFEEKINELKKLFPDGLIKEALTIKKYGNDTTVLNNRISGFLQKNTARQNISLVNFLAGQLLLEAGEFQKAEKYFIKGIELNPENKTDICETGEWFLNAGADEEALNFYDDCVKKSKDKAVALVHRGEYFYRTENYQKARDDFEKALVIDSSLEKAKIFLAKIINR